MSEKGERRTRDAGRLLKNEQYSFDVCHTSRLMRARQTLDILLEELGGPAAPVECHWRLNERLYGVLQERPRTEIAKQFGVDATIAWRRNYRARPPALKDDDPRWLEQRERFPDLDEARLPRSESFEDGVLRVEPYWRDELAPALCAGKRVLLVAHTCSIRGLVRLLDGLSDEEAEAFRIPAALPTVYELDDDLRPLRSYQLHGGGSNRWRQFRNKHKPDWMYWR